MSPDYDEATQRVPSAPSLITSSPNIITYALDLVSTQIFIATNSPITNGTFRPPIYSYTASD